MAIEIYAVAIERGTVGGAGEPCTNCDDETNLVEAVVTYMIADEDDDGRLVQAPTDIEVCGDCVWHVIRASHIGDAVPHILLTPDAPIPPGIL